jgi:hypothetical protein
MKLNRHLDTAILLPFITSIAAYILIFSHLSRPGCPGDMRKENAQAYNLHSLERIELTVQTAFIYPMDLVVMEPIQTSTE